MFCSNCGTKFKEIDKFCGCCGKPRYVEEHLDNIENNLPTSVVNNVSTEQHKKGFPLWATLLICLAILLGVGIVVVILAIVAFSFVSSEVNGDFDNVDIYEQQSYYVYLYSDSVPTIYNLLGEYKLCDIPEYGENNITYFYCDNTIGAHIFDEYLDILISEYGFVEQSSDENSRLISMPSSSNGYSLVINVDYNYDSIEYERIRNELYTEDSSI